MDVVAPPESTAAFCEVADRYALAAKC